MPDIAKWTYGGYSGTVNEQGKLLLSNGIDTRLKNLPNHKIINIDLGAEIGVWTDKGQIILLDGSEGQWLKAL